MLYILQNIQLHIIFKMYINIYYQYFKSKKYLTREEKTR